MKKTFYTTVYSPEDLDYLRSFHGEGLDFTWLNQPSNIFSYPTFCAFVQGKMVQFGRTNKQGGMGRQLPFVDLKRVIADLEAINADVSE